MSSITDIFGFHNQWITSNHGMKADAEDKSNYLKHNITQILGYIPLVGLFIGIFRIAHYRKEMLNEKNSEKFAGHAILITRGVFEILGLGVVFLAPDLIATAARAASAYQRNKRESAF